MTGFSLDNSGQARLALQDILNDYGLAGIDDDALIDRHLPDLLPDAPREAGLLRAAATAKVGHLLTDRFNAKMPPEAAVRDVAAMLADRTAFDANACLWVVVEYAAVLGHAVDLTPKSPPVFPPPVSGPPVSPPPAAGPPVFVPPVAVPPVFTPPVSGPPISGPPVSGPPVSGPPISGAPISGSPVSGSPTSGSPASGPPISGPPVSLPPQQGGMPGGQRPPVGFPPPQNASGFPPQQAAGIPQSGMPQSGMPPYAPGPPPYGAYPSQQPPPGQFPNADQTRMDTQGGQPFAPGRAGAVGYNPDFSGQFQVRPPRSKVPLIVGIIVVLAVVGTIGIAFALKAATSCSASGPGALSAAATKCVTGPSPKTHVSHTPSVGPSTPPGGGNSGDPGNGGDGTLASVMPKDLDLDSCDQDDTLINDDETDYSHCDDAASDESGLTIWAYQYADEQGTKAALADFNSNVSFKSHSSNGCPAPTDSSATGGWYRSSQNDILGTLECYTNTSDEVVYIWTSWSDNTLIIAESDEDTFKELNSWWKVNNANDEDR